MSPNDKKPGDNLEELAKTDPDVREFLDILGEMDAGPDADPNPPPLTDEEKEKLIEEWEKAPGVLR